MKPEEQAGGEPIAPAVETAPSEPMPESPTTRWGHTVIVAGGRIPADVGNRRVIVAEHRPDDELDEDGEVKTLAETKLENYPTKADLYYRTDERVKFPADADVVTLGVNVRQGRFDGFLPAIARRPAIAVGPAHPAYGAANLAYQRGAKIIDIHGLSKAQQDKLKPWFDSKKMPEDVKINFI